MRTLGKGKSRTALSVLIMLLAVLLLTSVWMEYVSLQEDVYLDTLSPWDYTISDGSAVMEVQRYNQNSRSITEEVVEEIRQRPEVTSVSALKSREVDLTASEELQQRVVDYYDQPYDETMTLRESQAGYPDWVAGLDRFAQTGEYTALVIGLDGSIWIMCWKTARLPAGNLTRKPSQRAALCWWAALTTMEFLLWLRGRLWNWREKRSL